MINPFARQRSGNHTGSQEEARPENTVATLERRVQELTEENEALRSELRKALAKMALGGNGGNGGNGGPRGHNGGANRRGGEWKRALAAGLAGSFAVAATFGAWFGIGKAASVGVHNDDQSKMALVANAQGVIDVADLGTDFDRNIADLEGQRALYDDSIGYLQGRVDYPGNPLLANQDKPENPDDIRTALEDSKKTSSRFDKELAEEINNQQINKGVDDLAAKYDEAIANGQQAGATDDILNQLSTLSERNSSNPDEAKGFLQSKIDTLSSKITSEKYGVTIDQYNQYKKASEATGLSIEKIDEYSKYYGVNANNFGTKAAFEQMRDQAKGQRVNEEMKADSPEEAKEELLFIAYNNPAALAQYANGLNEDTKTDAGVEGFKTPGDVTSLYRQYINENDSYTEKFYADFTEFKEALSNATVTERAATSRDSLSYMYDNDDVTVVNVKENSGGDNKKIYIIKMVNKDGVEVIFNLKDVCAQLSVQKPAPVVKKAKPQVVKYKVTHGKVEKVPTKPKTPSTPATPTPDNPVTPPVTPDAKIQAQNIIQTNTDKTADSGSSNATTSGEVDTTTNAGNADKGTDDNRTGTEYQPDEPTFDEKA